MFQYIKKYLFSHNEQKLLKLALKNILGILIFWDCHNKVLQLGHLEQKFVVSYF